MAFLSAPPLLASRRPCSASSRAPSARPTTMVVPVGNDASSARPVSDRLLVRVKQNESMSTGGLLLSLDAETRPKIGRIVGIPSVENKWTGDDFQVGDNVLWRHDYVAEVVQDFVEDDGGRVVSVRMGNISATWRGE